MNCFIISYCVFFFQFMSHYTTVILVFPVINVGTFPQLTHIDQM